MRNQIIRCVFNADMRCGHDGLTKVAKKLSVNTSSLDIGQYIIFVNTAKTIVKIYAAGNVIAHYKSPKGQINLKTLAFIPKYFNGHSLNYYGALAEVIRKEIRE